MSDMATNARNVICVAVAVYDQLEDTFCFVPNAFHQFLESARAAAFELNANKTNPLLRYYAVPHSANFIIVVEVMENSLYHYKVIDTRNNTHSGLSHLPVAIEVCNQMAASQLLASVKPFTDPDCNHAT